GRTRGAGRWASGAGGSSVGWVKSSKRDRSRRRERPPLLAAGPTGTGSARTRRARARAHEEGRMERDRARRPLFELDDAPQAAKIKVIGLGGGGGNAVSRMNAAQFTGGGFIVTNTDVHDVHSPMT